MSATSTTRGWPMRSSMRSPLPPRSPEMSDAHEQEELPRMLQPAPAAQRLVFVGGLHRSGTSLVHRCLADHPRASGFRNTGVWEDEGQHLQTVYRPAGSHGG